MKLELSQIKIHLFESKENNRNVNDKDYFSGSGSGDSDNNDYKQEMLYDQDINNQENNMSYKLISND